MLVLYPVVEAEQAELIVKFCASTTAEYWANIWYQYNALKSTQPVA